MSIVYDRIKQLCKEDGTNIVQLEQKLNFTRNSIAYWSKTAPPNIERILLIADHFEVSVDYLLGRTSNRRLIYSEIPEHIAGLFELIEKINPNKEQTRIIQNYLITLQAFWEE